ncbi:MAG: ABC transporter permease, partial [Bacteroidota bacterium]
MKKWADCLFKWYCHPEYYPDIKGDLEELYDRHQESGISNPELKYIFDVLLLFRLSLVRPVLINSIINKTMFFNYLKISMRTLMRNKVYAGINIFGLAVGLAGFLLINEYVQFERGYDSFHDQADNLYRVSTIEKGGSNGDVKDAMASYSLGEHLNNQIPEITSHTVTKKLDNVILRNGNVVFNEKNTISADSAFLDHFTYKIISGSKEELFKEPYAIVLSESKAKTYFGDVNPVGKTIEVLSPLQVKAKVTGVIQDIPENTHYHFDILISDKSLADGDDYKNWSYNNYYVYMHIQPGTDIDELNKKIAGEPRSILDDDSPDFWYIHPVQDIYLNSDYTFEPQIMGSSKAVSIL